jgi:hypothetical protein
MAEKLLTPIHIQLVRSLNALTVPYLGMESAFHWITLHLLSLLSLRNIHLFIMVYYAAIHRNI